jgi:hypothetical protein
MLLRLLFLIAFAGAAFAAEPKFKPEPLPSEAPEGSRPLGPAESLKTFKITDD